MSEYVSPLRRMIEDMTVRNLSTTTQASHMHNVKKFSQCFDRSPDRLGLEDVRACKDVPERIAYARRPKTLPVVLSPEEVAAFLEAVPNRRDRVALTIAYATGLRASEALSYALVVGLHRTGITRPLHLHRISSAGGTFTRRNDS
jgi:integrase/recombinase XerD